MSTSADTWGDEPSFSVKPAMIASGSKSTKAQKPETVVDDWELDDDDDQDFSRPTDEKNKQIWEDANSKEFRPMPSLVISRNSTAIALTPSLPLHQPPQMRILKRPSPTTTAVPSASSVAAGGTLREREARYQAARERIFGVSGDESLQNTVDKNNGESKKASRTSSYNSSVKVVREPRGPPNTDDTEEGNSRGFVERRGKQPPRSLLPDSVSLPPANIPT